VLARVLEFARHHHLLEPGERVAVGVSGGADSVALVRILVELKNELGIVLSVAHFHHGIRGAEADADRQFVRELAEHLGLEFNLGGADAPAHARAHRMSLETAARELRHQWFALLIEEDKADKIATAHTLDDQAETVLMRLARGAGVRGLAGIFPWQKQKHLVRPLLAVRRAEVEGYLKQLGQRWREDSSNRDLAHTRNRVRHLLLPLLEREFNPEIRKTLSDLAEVARAESDYWEQQLSALVPKLVRQGKPTRSGRTARGESSRILAVDLTAWAALPLALQRKTLHQVAERLGSTLEFAHVDELIELARQHRSGKRLTLPGGLTAVRSFRELQFIAGEELGSGDYQYSLAVPGEVAVPELGSVIRARIVPNQPSSASLLNLSLLGPELIIRNWRAGDRFFPAKTRAPKKLKQLLQSGRLAEEISPSQRKAWPVVESAGQIVWVRSLAVPEAFAAKSGEALLIEEIPIP
jgi:tRNA(Ile)-lysidine synthase